MTFVAFESDILAPSHKLPQVVLFTATWCEPCLWVKPILHELAAENAASWRYAEIDLDASPEVAAHFGLRSVPATLVFQNGELRGKYNGMLWKKEFLAWIRSNLQI